MPLRWPGSLADLPPTLPPTIFNFTGRCVWYAVARWRRRASTATHAFYPPRFKAAVQQLLFAAAAQQGGAGAGGSPHNPPLQAAMLPGLAFTRVLQLAGAPLGDWL